MHISRKLRAESGVIAVGLGLASAAILSGGAAALSPARPRAVSVGRDRNLPAPTAKALTGVGLSVDWPLARGVRTVRPGAQLVVSLAALDTKGLATSGSVTLTATSGGRGRTLAAVPLGDVSGTSLTGWRLRLLIPRVEHARYRLVLSAGKVRYSSRFRSSGAALSTAAGAGVGHAAKVTLSPLRTVPGQSVAFSVEDTGTDPLEISGLAWQEESSQGSWATYAYGATCCPGEACPQYIVLAERFWSVTLGPGDVVANTETVPPATADGAFRLAPLTGGTPAAVDPGLTLSSEPTQVTASDPCTATTTPTTTAPTTPTVTTGPIRPQPQARAGTELPHSGD